MDHSPVTKITRDVGQCYIDHTECTTTFARGYLKSLSKLKVPY